MCLHMHKQRERMEPNHKDVSDDNRDISGHTGEWEQKETSR
jgi:hypothetical protein